MKYQYISGWHGSRYTLGMGDRGLKERIRDMEKEEILRALGECDWVMARAAKQLGITERMIGYKIRKYGIRKDGIKDHICPK